MFSIFFIIFLVFLLPSNCSSLKKTNSSSSPEDFTEEILTIGIIVGSSVVFVALVVMILWVYYKTVMVKKYQKQTLSRMNSMKRFKVVLNKSGKGTVADLLRISRKMVELKPDEVTIKKQEIGRGRFCQVYKGEWKRQSIAVKLFPDDVFEDKDEFEKTLLNWNVIDHPNIIKFYGYLVFPNCGFLMELCEMGSLADFILNIDDYTINITDKEGILFGIAAGMKFFHSHNIIIDVLSPRDILLTDDLTAKITDRRLEKSLSNKKQLQRRNSSETEAYYFPNKEKKITKTSNIFGFGIICYELLSESLLYVESGGITKKKKNETDKITISGRESPAPIEELERDSTLFKMNNDPNYRPVLENESQFPSYLVDLMKLCWDVDIKKRPNFKDIISQIVQKTDPVSLGPKKKVKRKPITIYLRDENTAEDDADDYTLDTFTFKEVRRLCYEKFGQDISIKKICIINEVGEYVKLKNTYDVKTKLKPDELLTVFFY